MIRVTKWGHTVPVSCCMLTDATGENHCQHPPHPPSSGWWRTKYALQSWWWRNRPTVHRGPCDHDDCDY